MILRFWYSAFAQNAPDYALREIGNRICWILPTSGLNAAIACKVFDKLIKEKAVFKKTLAKVRYVSPELMGNRKTQIAHSSIDTIECRRVRIGPVQQKANEVLADVDAET